VEQSGEGLCLLYDTSMYSENEATTSMARKLRQFFFSRMISLNVATFLLILNTASCASSENTMQQIKQGSRVPSFVLPDQNGKLFDIGSVLGKKNLVIYFYPKDDSPGCTKEACSFRDQYEVFRQADAEIIGISSDDVDSHKKFADKYHLTYTLLSDKGGKIRDLFGVPSGLFGLLPGRVTYVVDKQGIVVHTFDSQLNTEQHITESLAALKTLEK
jgi:thioredoxin-dependent peroxiredoxin